MALIQLTPEINQMVNGSTDTVGSIANFIVDNNPTGVFIVLRANGYTFNTSGEAAIIVRSIITGTSQKTANELEQLKNVPYLNDNTNGTGGINSLNAVGANGGTIDGTKIGGVVGSVACIAGSIFGLNLCPPPATGTSLTVEQQVAADKAAADAKRKNTIIIGSIIGVVVLIVVVLVIKNKNKNKN